MATNPQSSGNAELPKDFDAEQAAEIVSESVAARFALQKEIQAMHVPADEVQGPPLPITEMTKMAYDAGRTSDEVAEYIIRFDMV